MGNHVKDASIMILKVMRTLDVKETRLIVYYSGSLCDEFRCGFEQEWKVWVLW